MKHVNANFCGGKKMLFLNFFENKNNNCTMMAQFWYIVPKIKAPINNFIILLFYWMVLIMYRLNI